MELFALEHKRLWRSTRVWLCVLLCFMYSVIYGGVLSFQWFVFGSEGEDTTSPYENNFDGYTAIRDWQEEFSQFGDYWTDETFQKMVAKYQSYDIYERPGLQSMGDWMVAQSFLNHLYPELEDSANQTYQPLLLYADTEKLTDFYGKRQWYLDFNMEVARQGGLLTEADIDMLQEMNSQIEEPWKYEWTQGWNYLLTTALPNISAKIAPFLAIALGFLFSGEWHDSTAPLLHTTKHGWRKLARVKVLSGLSFAVELFVLIAGGMVIAQLIYFGTSGWDMPIQFIKEIAVAPWNMLKTELFELAFTFLGVIGYAGMTMLFSSLVKNNVLALVLSLSITYVPNLLGRYLPLWAQEVSQYLPLVGSPSDIFRMNVFHIFGKGIWSPYMLISVPIVIGIVCVPFAIKGWARRQKA